MTVRLSDPKPSFCSGCLKNAADGRYVDFEAAFDAGTFVGGEDRHYVAGSDDLHLCEQCVKTACEVLGMKPELHGRQYSEIKRLELELDYWRSYAKRIEQTVAERPEPAPRPAQRRKVAA